MKSLLHYRCSPSGQFGVKMHFDQYTKYFGDDSLNKYFPKLRYLYITRQDHTRQAISWWRALSTQQWHSFHPETTMPTYDCAEILSVHMRVIHMQLLWERYFARHSVEPFRLTYEELVSYYGETARRVLKFLGKEIPSDFVVQMPGMKKLADDSTESILDRYRADLRERGIFICGNS